MLILVAKGLCEFQIPSGGGIDEEICVAPVSFQLGNQFAAVFLRVVEIAKRRARRERAERIIGETERLRGRRAEVFGEQRDRIVPEKGAVRQLADCKLLLMPEAAIEREILSFQQFRRMKLRQNVPEFLPAVRLRHEKASRRNVRKGKAVAAVFLRNRGEIIIFLLLESACRRHGAGCHDANHFALYKAFCELRVFHLLGDRDLIAPLHEAVDVGVGGVKRDAAHRRPLLEAALFSRQREFELL